MSRARNLAERGARGRTKPRPTTTAGRKSFLTQQWIALLGVLLAAATIALYSPVFGCPFVILDDYEYVTGNPYIQGGLTWSTIKWAFTSTETGAYWHPLTWLSHGLDCQMFGLNPAGHHFDSVLIHGLNAGLLFVLLVWLTKRLGASLLVAALFAVHPLNVESVAWVAERKNVLSTLFFILAIGAYVWYVRKPHWQRYLAVAGLFAAGLMAKPMVTTLPFVLLLLDYWPLERTTLDRSESSLAATGGTPRKKLWWLLLEKVPLLLLSAASSKITLITQRRVELTFGELPFGLRIENAILSYGLYLWKMLWPARLAAFYPLRETTPIGQVILSAVVLVVGTMLVVAFRKKGYLPVGWFWFLGTLVPVIGLVQVWKQAMADRFAYIPLIGIFIMIAWGFDDWAAAKKFRTVWRVIPALCVLSALAFATTRQIGYWGSQYDFWLRSLEVEESPDAHNGVGAALIADSAKTMSQRDLENLDTDQKRMDEARRDFERVVELCRQREHQHPACLPEMVTALNNLAFLDRAQHRPDETQRQHYELALQIWRQMEQQGSLGRYRSDVVFFVTLINLGNLDLNQKRMDEARQHYEQGLKIYRQLAQRDQDKYQSDVAKTLANLGILNILQNRPDEAREYLEEALMIYGQQAQQNPATYLPGLVTTLNNLGNLDLNQKRMNEARQHFEALLGIYRQLAQQDPARYANEVASVEARLAELGKKAPQR
jgi:protein O-mannosyl-transferase